MKDDNDDENGQVLTAGRIELIATIHLQRLFLLHGLQALNDYFMYQSNRKHRTVAQSGEKEV